MNKFLANLNERERWIVIIGIVAVVCGAFYTFLYSPLQESLSKNTLLLAEKKETLQWMQSVSNQQTSSKVRKTINNTQLLTLIATELKSQSGLKFPYQLQQTGSGEIQLSFDQVPFQNFILWLNNLRENYVVNVTQFNVEKSATPGVIKLQVVLGAN